MGRGVHSLKLIYTVFHKITTRYLIGHNFSKINVDQFSIFFTNGLSSDCVFK